MVASQIGISSKNIKIVDGFKEGLKEMGLSKEEIEEITK